MKKYSLLFTLLISSFAWGDLVETSKALERKYEKRVDTTEYIYGGAILADGTYTVERSRGLRLEFTAPAGTVALWRTKTRYVSHPAPSSLDLTSAYPVYVDGVRVN